MYLTAFLDGKKTQTKIHTEGSTRLLERGDFSERSESRVRECKTSHFSVPGRRKISLSHFLTSMSFSLCVESLVTESAVTRFRASGFIPICDTDILNAFDKSLFVCTLGSSSAEGGWAVNLAVFLSWA